MTSPSDYGLPHNQWRPYQLDTLQWAEQQNGIMLVESPTGSGKTTIPAGLAHRHSVGALVKTKNLQQVNYQDAYGFDILMGRANYSCIFDHHYHVSECEWGEVMHDCSLFPECEYVLAKEATRRSHKACYNYALWLTAAWAREDPPQVLVCDEGDELPDIIVDYAGVEVSEKQRREWDLPTFPVITSGYSLIDTVNPTDEALDWLNGALKILREAYKTLRGDKSQKGRAKFRTCEKLGIELRTTRDALYMSTNDWYIRSGQHLFAKPLTAKYHFPTLFDVSDKVMIMSATIGQDPKPLATELGIRDFAFRSVPSVWPAEDRPIWIPENAPKIGSKAKELDYEHQADLASRAIQDCPGDWFGIVLVTSKVEAKNVAHRLARRGLQDRIWVIPDKTGTDRQTELWQIEKQKRPGAIMISWNHWRGYDGLDEKLLLVLKTPFPQMGSPGTYQNEKMRYGKGLYQWRTANILAQGVGRTRRGRPEDYGPDSGLVCVLDANYSLVKKHLPAHFLEAIVH